MTPYYHDQHAGITIYHADCLSVLPTLADKSFDLVLTDPPYNVGKSYGDYGDTMPHGQYAAWCGQWFAQCRRIARRVIVFCGHSKAQQNLRMWLDHSPGGIGCWYKPGNTGGGGAFQFCEWEPWLLWGPRIGGADVIRAPISRQFGLDGHPDPKPARLFTELLVRTRARTVLDPFLGSGTTTTMAKKLGIHATGIEISERYCSLAVARLAQEVLPFEPAETAAISAPQLPLSDRDAP